MGAEEFSNFLKFGLFLWVFFIPAPSASNAELVPEQHTHAIGIEAEFSCEVLENDQSTYSRNRETARKR